MSSSLSIINIISVFFFFFYDPAPTEIYTLSLHDALPISARRRPAGACAAARRRPCRSASCTRTSPPDRKSTRLNSSHANTSYAVFCLKKKKKKNRKKNIKTTKKRPIQKTYSSDITQQADV